VDWMQKIYQYYLADRQEKKQDYTPASIFYMGRKTG
jgi:type I restriction enzyme M protein